MPWRFNPFTGNLDETDIPAFNGEVTLGSASSPSIFFTGDENTGVYSPGADQLALSTNGTGRLFVDASGNVGVGVNPSYRLHTSIYGSNYLYLDNTRGPASAYIGVLDSETQFVVGGAHPLTFATNSTERLRITSAGLVGIGTSSPTHALSVVDATAYRGIAISGNNAPNVNFANGAAEWKAGISGNVGTSFSISKGASNDDKLLIDSSGRVGIGTSTPGAKFEILNGHIRLSDQYRIGVGGTSGTPDQTTIKFSSDNLGLFTGNTERARIDSSGRLLVGTSTESSNNLLVVEGSTTSDTGGAIAALKRGTNVSGMSANDILGILRFTSKDSHVFADITGICDATPGADDYPGRLVFSTTADGASSPTERMRISANGDIKFDNGPSASLYFEGSASTSNYACYHRRDNTAYTIAQSSDSRVLRIGSGSGWTTTGVSLAAGATSWGTYSDERLKRDIVQLDNTLATLDGIRCVTYRFNTDESDSKKRLGVVAQDLIGKYDEALNQSKRTEDDPTEYYSVQYSDLVPVLLSALQEAKQRIETLEAKVAALESA